MSPKIFLTFLLVSCTVIAFSHAQEDDTKTITEFLDKFSKVDMDEILSNDRLFQTYHTCLMETGQCSPQAKEMRDIIPILVKSACESCTDDQKKGLKKLLDDAKTKRPAEWGEWKNKYDPEGERLEKFLASVSK